MSTSAVSASSALTLNDNVINMDIYVYAAFWWDETQNYISRTLSWRWGNPSPLFIPPDRGLDRYNAPGLIQPGQTCLREWTGAAALSCGKTCVEAAMYWPYVYKIAVILSLWNICHIVEHFWSSLRWLRLSGSPNSMYFSFFTSPLICTRRCFSTIWPWPNGLQV